MSLLHISIGIRTMSFIFDPLTNHHYGEPPLSPTTYSPYMASPPLDQRLSILTIAVTDLNESRRFYNDVFGWIPDDASEEEAANIAFYSLNGFKLSLYPLAKFAEEHGSAVAPPSGFTMAYNVNTEAEVDALFARFAEYDVRVLKAPEKVFWGGYSGYIAGPSGEQWEIAFNPFTSVQPDGTFGP